MAKKLTQNVTIQRNETEPESMELVAAAILSVERGFKALLNSGASEGLIVLLLHDMTKVSKVDIRKILHAAPRISAQWLK